jgi:hypothetical protein
MSSPSDALTEMAKVLTEKVTENERLKAILVDKDTEIANLIAENKQLRLRIPQAEVPEANLLGLPEVPRTRAKELAPLVKVDAAPKSIEWITFIYDKRPVIRNVATGKVYEMDPTKSVRAEMAILDKCIGVWKDCSVVASPPDTRSTAAKKGLATREANKAKAAVVAAFTAARADDPFATNKYRLQSINPELCMGRRIDEKNPIPETLPGAPTANGKLYPEKQCTKKPVPGGVLCEGCAKKDAEANAEPTKWFKGWYGRLDDESMYHKAFVLGCEYYFERYPTGIPGVTDAPPNLIVHS